MSWITGSEGSSETRKRDEILHRQLIFLQTIKLRNYFVFQHAFDRTYWQHQDPSS